MTTLQLLDLSSRARHAANHTATIALFFIGAMKVPAVAQVRPPTQPWPRSVDLAVDPVLVCHSAHLHPPSLICTHVSLFLLGTLITVPRLSLSPSSTLSPPHLSACVRVSKCVPHSHSRFTTSPLHLGQFACRLRSLPHLAHLHSSVLHCNTTLSSFVCPYSPNLC
ncbi:hypothetical protein GGR57DRAFT_321770 [Xylariaceae sp. FL1272]|nr:hypothetical protein GGR57DRAFT_321770 [Xylariaceae sp. FL1272]